MISLLGVLGRYDKTLHELILHVSLLLYCFLFYWIMFKNVSVKISRHTGMMTSVRFWFSCKWIVFLVNQNKINLRKELVFVTSRLMFFSVFFCYMYSVYSVYCRMYKRFSSCITTINGVCMISLMVVSYLV